MNNQDILKFLEKLKDNNNRDWFEENKPEYKNSLEAFVNLVEEIILGLAANDPAMGDLEAKKCVFRIYRDVRFAKDKSPYKVHFGAFMNPGGKKNDTAGYYIHLEPGKSIMGGGIYHPESSNLAKIRQEIDFNGDQLEKALKSAGYDDLHVMDGEKLVRPPKGYDATHPRIEWLKLKSFFMHSDLSDKNVLDTNFSRKAIDNFNKIKPLNDFLNTAIMD